MNIYVGNIPHSKNEDEIRELFEKIGPVASVKLITDKFTGAPRGFGFVQMDLNFKKFFILRSAIFIYTSLILKTEQTI